MKSLPSDALTVFQLGGWSALADYASRIAHGDYECPDAVHVLSRTHLHSYQCRCGGAGSIEIDHQPGGRYHSKPDKPYMRYAPRWE